MDKNKIVRRRFLQSVAAAAAASAVPASAQGDPLRMGMIGVGKRGNAHLNRFIERSEFSIKAVCDIDASARDDAQSKAKADNPRSYSDYKELLRQSDVDAVLIATPCYLHAEQSAAALEAGKHVFCEKPLGITAGQVKLVLNAARKSKAVFQVGLQSRNSPNMLEAVNAIHKEGLIGRPLVIKAQRHSTPSKPGTRREGGSGQERRFPGWYNDVKLSGDLIVENAVHNIDVCNWLAGSRPVSAFGHGKRYLPEPMPAGTVMMDGFSVEYIYQNDMHLDYSQLYLHPRKLKKLPNGMWFIVYGEKGAIELDYGMWTFYDMYGDAEPVEHKPTEEIDLTDAAHDDFVRAIRENRKPMADIETAAIAALTGIMGREAIYQRRMVTWDEMGVEI
ncbi:MAG TPA: Gfo/Idh/MocA family oxidoreductase [Bryobacterales bacterium]|nr:Gfo/Idh/MocA family oxidoreductase [Bryobacterales bacterium]